jgi:hypothetical protein
MSIETSTGSGGTRPGTPSDNTTLTAILADLQREGYSASFGARDGARLHCSSCRQERSVGDFEVDVMRRLEGASDPDAQVLLVAATCPSCGARGTVAFGYGPEASEVDALAVAGLDLEPEVEPD